MQKLLVALEFRKKPLKKLAFKDARILDPANNIDKKGTLFIREGILEKIVYEEHEVLEEGYELINCSGYIISPGFIDLHVHFYEGVSVFGIPIDDTCIEKGVTTAVDAGTAGAITYAGLERYVLQSCRTSVYAFLNYSLIGLITNQGELLNSAYVDPGRTIKVAEQYSDRIVGIKIRLSHNVVGDEGLRLLRGAKEVATALALPLMVHITMMKISLRDVLSLLSPGDIVTHIYTPDPNELMNNNGKTGDLVKEAKDRGIYFDVGHGWRSFSFDVARKALDLGIAPSVISTDLHALSISLVVDQATMMSRFLALGVSLPEVIEKSTIAPAQAIRKADPIGMLAPGSMANITIFRVVKGEFAFVDCLNKSFYGKEKIQPVAVLKNGELIRSKS